MISDLRYAFRSLLAAPRFALAAALTLVSGIGASSVMLGIGGALAYRPPPDLGDPDLVVRLEVASVSGPQYAAPALFAELSAPRFDGRREGTGPSVGVAAYARSSLRVGGGDATPDEQVVLVSGDYFGLLRTPMHLGQPIQPQHDSAEAASMVAVLSFDYWQRAFGADPSVLGTLMKVGDQSVTVIGVAGRGFTDSADGVPAVWIPMSLAPRLRDHETVPSSPFVS